MSRGRKAYQTSHIVFPTAEIAGRKKKTAAEVRLPNNLEEVIFTGKSRHECFKWIYATTNDQLIKVIFAKAPYVQVTPEALPVAQTMVEFYDQSSKSKINLVPYSKEIYGTLEKPKYALKGDHNGKSLIRFVSKAVFDTTSI